MINTENEIQEKIPETQEKIPENQEKIPETQEQIPETQESTSGAVQSDGALKICRFFLQKKYCRYGYRCRFQHHAPLRTNNNTSSRLKQGDTRKICYYFRDHGTCKYGNNCRFIHSTKLNIQKDENSGEVVRNPSSDIGNQNDGSEIVDNSEISQSKENVEPLVVPSEKVLESRITKPRIPFIPNLRKEIDANTTDETALSKLREIEISMLKKRFPDLQHIDYEDDDLYSFAYSSSDPDWPFEVKEVKLQISIPKTYPAECFKAVLCNDDEQLPDLFVKYISNRITEWLQEKHTSNKDSGRVELLFRPFLHWFDRNLEELFISGLKKVKKEMEAKQAGLEFVPFESLPGSQSVEAGGSQEESNLTADNGAGKFDAFLAMAGTSNGSSSTGKNAQTSTQRATGVVTAKSSGSLSNRGTEIRFKNLQLSENCATLICKKVAIIIQCSRCKTNHDIALMPKQITKAYCTKCHHTMQMNFRPSILHQFTATAGVLDLSGCKPFDVTLCDCSFNIVCLECNKDMKVDGIHYGQHQNTWCHHCNAKLSFYIESTKFCNLQSSGDFGGNKGAQLLKLEPKTKKAVHDPLIQEGKPLPDNGSCKHYKKSFRWLRFPCCGKAYPCDVCHDEKENDHTMKYATRMICGFCAVEQPFATEKPCTSCSSNMTKKSGTHWEAGKGCRDKIKMSRNDKQKYSGTGKTVSRKSQDIKGKSSKSVNK